MPPNKKQKSRLNSSIDIKTKHQKSIERTSKLSVMEEKSIAGEDELQCATECYEEMQSEESETKIKKDLSRTSFLIQEYREFKAARSIQRFVRGWLYHSKYRQQRKSAILIQKEWRRFYCQRLYFRKFEEMLQQRIEQHFHCSAQKIQALWRGWWVRHHIHDHTRLMRMQLMAGEDLLYCVAFKLHHLLRTHQIPGVYSLRNSSALSKVEQLLASLSFKTCNQHTVQAKDQRQAEIDSARKLHKKSAFGTKVPFAGPNINNLCAPKCAPLYSAKEADLRMSKILQMYEQGNREMSQPEFLKKKSQKTAPSIPPAKPSTFCGDVVRSMKKWKLIKESNLNVDSNVFRNPQNVESFVKEIQSKLSVVEGNCYCRREFEEDLNKEKKKYLAKPDNNRSGDGGTQGSQEQYSFEASEETPYSLASISKEIISICSKVSTTDVKSKGNHIPKENINLGEDLKVKRVTITDVSEKEDL